MPQFLLMAIHQRRSKVILHLLILLTQIGHAQLAALTFALRSIHDQQHNDGNGHYNGDDFCQK